MRMLALGAALALLGGCTISPADLEALANDHNSDCLTETSVWVSVTLERNGGCHYPPQGFVLVPLAAAAPATPGK